MKTFTHIFSLRNYLSPKRDKNLKIALVPTMGALHEGHLTLIREAKSIADIVVCSIFVNPSQFNNDDDLDKYPRQTEADKKLLNQVDCDILFHPSVEEVYPEGSAMPKVSLDGIELVMEGEKRPGHFEGVVEVVSRLFDIVSPDKALFGEKDFQQLAIIRKMTKKLNYPIDIVGVEIVRSDSGLALSSRNMRLSDSALQQATFIYKTLNWAKIEAKTHDPSSIRTIAIEKFENHGQFNLEYFELADSNALQPVEEWDNENGTRAFVAAWIEGVRLIDNMEIVPPTKQ